MEKAKLNLNKNKKGEYTVTLIFESSKPLPMSDFKLQNDKLNGKDVEVLRESGQAKKIICDGEIIYEKSSSSAGSSSQTAHRAKTTNRPQSHTQKSSSHDRGNIAEAFAPYNFVPLNDKVVPAEGIPAFDAYHQDKYTGYIDLEIETKTPLYIRDTLTEEEMARKAKKEKNKETYNPSDFFSPGDRLRIPGSSLRGMTRTMVEIISYGKFGFFDDRRLYFRGLADMSNLRKEYQSKMSSFDRNSKKTAYKMSAGYLYRKGLQYYIQPAKGFRQISKEESKQLIKQQGAEYNIFTSYKMNNGFIVVSGDMQNKKRDWFIDLPDNSANHIKVLSVDIQDYRDDNGRHKDAPNLLTLASKDKTPCFYTRYKDATGKDRLSFGHTAMFRLPYTKTIGDHIPATLKDPNVIDLAEAIFGNEKTFAGRVFFEDAFCLSTKEEALMGEKVPQILASPKPTTFQHYLEQNTENLRDHPKNLAHYNSNTNIRGYKLYWHKDGSDWQQIDTSAIAEHSSQYTKINPVKPDVKFSGRIRFENLSSVELGALLFALDLPEGCCHKLGMAKPLGLGSVRITPKLFISDRTRRYKSLTAEWSEAIRESSMSEYKGRFEDYVKGFLKTQVSSLWEVERLRELKIMLNFQNKPQRGKTRYMEIERMINGRKENEYKNRPVLPHPTKVKTS